MKHVVGTLLALALLVALTVATASEVDTATASGAPTREMPAGRAEFVDAVDQLYIEGNVSAGADLLKRSVLKGYAQAYPLLGMCHQYGIGVAQSDAKAALYYSFGALAGSIDANLALAYRYQHGIGMPKSCPNAVKHAQFAADHVARSYASDVYAKVEMTKLSDLNTNVNDAGKNKEAIQMHEFRADKGVVTSLVILGYAHMLGTRGVAQDGHQAQHFFEEAATKGDAAGHGGLGQLYVQGMTSATPPIARDTDKALEHFAEGAKQEHPVSLNGLGYMYAKGDGVQQSFAEAAKYFEKSAVAGNAEGLYNIGVLYLNGKGVKKDYHQAVNFFVKAAAAGSVLAHWQLGPLNMKGVGGLSMSCSAAMRHYRMVLERAPWNKRVATAANEYLDGDYTASLLDYLQAAEVGMTVGRTNAAYILERNLGLESLDLRGSSTNSTDADETRLTILHQLVVRSAHEGDVDAHLKLGDHYFYGVACDVDFEKAEEHYSIAAGSQHPQALFNLGYMREHGLGSTAKDFHLAKRFYDATLQANAASFYLVQAALVKLNFHWWAQFYAEQPGGLVAAFVPAPYGVPLDDVVLAFFVGLAILLLLLRNHAIAMADN